MRTAVDEVAVLLRSFERSLASTPRNRSPKTIRGYVESARLFAGFRADHGMPRAVGAIHPEHVEVFIADQFDRWMLADAGYLRSYARSSRRL